MTSLNVFAKLIRLLFVTPLLFQRHNAIRDFNLGYIWPFYIQVRVFDDLARAIVYEDLEAPPEALTITCPSRLALHPPLATLHRTSLMYRCNVTAYAQPDGSIVRAQNAYDFVSTGSCHLSRTKVTSDMPSGAFEIFDKMMRVD